MEAKTEPQSEIDIHELEEKVEHNLFSTVMWIRIIYGLVRVVFGLALLKIVGMSFLDILNYLLDKEIVFNPLNFIYTFTVNWLEHNPMYVTYFLASYFIFWGTLDTVLSYNLLKDKHWAFPVSLVLIVVFVIYEIFRFTHTHSLMLLWIIIFDIFLFWLIKREYNRVKTESR